MDELAKANGSFMKQIALVFIAVLTSTMIGYFIWLGIAILAIRNDVEKIDLNVKSLLTTRSTQATEASAKNTRQIEELQNQVKATER